jgi:hypothetical protein
MRARNRPEAYFFSKCVRAWSNAARMRSHASSAPREISVAFALGQQHQAQVERAALP